MNWADKARQYFLPVLAGAVGLLILYGIVSRTYQTFFGPKGTINWQTASVILKEKPIGSRPVLYEFSAEWCPPCRMMDQLVFSDAEVAALINTNFTPVRVMDRRREEGKNPPDIETLQTKYNIEAFPTMVVSSADGREISRTTGFQAKEVLWNFLSQALERSRQPLPPAAM